MPITDPVAIRYVNEVVRPLCEKVRALKAEIDSARATYDAGVGDLFFNFGGEPIEDGREAEGVSRLTGNHVLAFNALVNYDLKALLEDNGAEATIAVPCVRPLEAR